MILTNVTIVEGNKLTKAYKGQMYAQSANLLLEKNDEDTKCFTQLDKKGNFLVREENLTNALDIINYFNGVEHTAWEMSNGEIMNELRDHCGDILKSWTDKAPIVAAFQTWRNGNEMQVSALYEGNEVSDFIEKHRTSNTFATLHTFTNSQQAIDMYGEFVSEMY